MKSYEDVAYRRTILFVYIMNYNLISKLESKLSDIRLYSVKTLLRFHSHYRNRDQHKWYTVFDILSQQYFSIFSFAIFQSKGGKKGGKKCGNSMGGDVVCKLIDATSDAACKIIEKVMNGVIFACVSSNMYIDLIVYRPDSCIFEM